jgi:hypothetical protein
VNTSRRFPPPWSVDNPDMELGQHCLSSATALGKAARRLIVSPLKICEAVRSTSPHRSFLKGFVNHSQPEC